MDLEAIKNYLKVEHEEDDRQLLNQIAAAKSHIINGIGRYIEGHPQFELVLQMLVEHWYENKGIYESGKTGSSIPFTAENILTQLRYVSVEELENEKKDQSTPAPSDLSKENRDTG
ncbi:head-tail connector protein [Bacillus velezensis]|uniref:head-tail connector protein n=1 Tax=Bacillus velezensis TaxID=492670 RepID=UPI00191B8E63|nr:head-tail connector protein [Bacillus velezensis]UQX44860.1 head-tail connector protein [Bacillus velezensis]